MVVQKEKGQERHQDTSPGKRKCLHCVPSIEDVAIFQRASEDLKCEKKGDHNSH